MLDLTIIDGLSQEYVHLSIPCLVAFVSGSSGLTAYGGFYDLCKPKKGERGISCHGHSWFGSIVGNLLSFASAISLGVPEAKARSLLFTLILTLQYLLVGEGLLTDLIQCPESREDGSCGLVADILDGSACGTAFNMVKVEVIHKRMNIEEFLVSDYTDEVPEFVKTISGHVRIGLIRLLQDISKGLESVPHFLCSSLKVKTLERKSSSSWYS
ncbi:hypothetical protein CRG98_003933 [Punica granatum]|uniref:Uncharacterized protein n=1 Tax=Punica granatum TaxID=22663 RepID=A0A2I0L4V9_PUNGR|nr:hypothetical protein CRG98_003933 [Punica granatum]